MSAFFRKYRILLFITLSFSIVLLIRLLRPFVIIRLGPLFSSRIGEFTRYNELYLCERDKGLHQRRTFDIFYHTVPICNHQLKKMWDRCLFHIDFIYQADRINHLIPGGEKHEIPAGYTDKFGLMRNTLPHISFTNEEEYFGRKEIRRIGIPENAAFVCFFARDPSYLNTKFPKLNFTHHNYRDCSINSFSLAAEELARRGYFMVRMGAKVEQPLVTDNPMIIDYATKHRTDFLDIYLSARCKYFISCNSGIDEVPKIFRRPVSYVNFIPLNSIKYFEPVDLFIPKKLWSREKNRLMTFKEIFDEGIYNFYYTKQYEELGIDFIEDTPEEIAKLAIETEERIRGTWQGAPEDEGLQRCFWSLVKPDLLQARGLSRVGADFLRQNQNLLQ